MPRQKTVFIASSGKAKALAKPLALYLTGELPDSDIREWYDQNTFPPSKATLDGLLAQAGECDFAIVLLTRDDFLDKTAQLSALGTPAPLTNDVSGKGNQQPDAPRDNTIFELGMFMGALGAERCFMVCSLDENSNALPSDLKGIKYYKIEPPADLSKADECRKCVKLAGAWIVAVAGFGGMRDHDGALSFAPRLPKRLTRVVFGMCFRGRRLRVEVTPEEARYSLLEGPPLQITHHGRAITVTTDEQPGWRIPEINAGEPPSQPYGRAPARRSQAH